MCCDLRRNITQQVWNLIRNDIPNQKWDSNWRPLVYKTSALTTALRKRMCCDLRRNLTQQVWNLFRNDIAKPNLNQLCSPLWDLKSRPLVYKTSALTNELRRIMSCDLRRNLTKQVWNLIRNDIAKPCSPLWDSNWRPLVYKASALTTDLRRLMCCDLRRNLPQHVWNLIRNDIAKPKTVQPLWDSNRRP